MLLCKFVSLYVRSSGSVKGLELDATQLANENIRTSCEPPLKQKHFGIRMFLLF